MLLLRRILLALTCLAVALAVDAAPIPRGKPIPAAPAPLMAGDITGAWEMRWGNENSWHPTWFQPLKVYHCDFGGSPWTGTWDVDAAGVLTVREGPAGGQPTLTWTVKLAADRSGEATGVGIGATKFALRKRRPDA